MWKIEGHSSRSRLTWKFSCWGNNLSVWYPPAGSWMISVASNAAYLRACSSFCQCLTWSWYVTSAINTIFALLVWKLSLLACSQCRFAVEFVLGEDVIDRQRDPWGRGRIGLCGTTTSTSACSAAISSTRSTRCMMYLGEGYPLAHRPFWRLADVSAERAASSALCAPDNSTWRISQHSIGNCNPTRFRPCIPDLARRSGDFVDVAKARHRIAFVFADSFSAS